MVVSKRVVLLVPVSNREISFFSWFQDPQKSLFSVHFGKEIITRDFLSSNGLIGNTRAKEFSDLKANMHNFLPGFGVQTMEIRMH